MQNVYSGLPCSSIYSLIYSSVIQEYHIHICANPYWINRTFTNVRLWLFHTDFSMIHACAALLEWQERWCSCFDWRESCMILNSSLVKSLMLSSSQTLHVHEHLTEAVISVANWQEVLIYRNFLVGNTSVCFHLCITLEHISIYTIYDAERKNYEHVSGIPG